jgi:hypothetical protein
LQKGKVKRDFPMGRIIEPGKWVMGLLENGISQQPPLF